MRPLSEEETKMFFEKLANYIGSNIKFLIEREDEDHVFRLHKQKVYYASATLVKLISNIGYKLLQLKSLKISKRLKQ